MRGQVLDGTHSNCPCPLILLIYGALCNAFLSPGTAEYCREEMVELKRDGWMYTQHTSPPWLSHTVITKDLQPDQEGWPHSAAGALRT